jgi:hypothetical protein
LPYLFTYAKLLPVSKTKYEESILDTQDTTSTQDKQVTIDVPEDRVAEFYAFYSRFLAVGSERRRGGGRGGHRGGHHRGGPHGGGYRCGPRSEHVAAEQGAAGTSPAPGPDAESVA